MIGLSDARSRRLREHLAVPLFRNGYSLVASTVATSILGVLFWGIAARHSPAAELGVDAALISAMTLIANVSHLNLTTALNRFVPALGEGAGRLIAGSYLVAGGLTAVTAGVFVLGVRAWAPSLAALADSPQFAVAFVGSTVAWVLFQLQDSALTGLRRGTTVLVSNLAYATVKVGLLVVLVSYAPSHGIFAAWVLPLVPAVLIVNWQVFARLVPRHAADAPRSEDRVGPTKIARYVAADYSASMLWRATLHALPLLGLWLAGVEATAYLHVALTITYALYLASQNMGMAFITEAARDPAGVHRYARQALTRTLMLGVPIVAITVAAAPAFLHVFGADYAREASTLLRLLAASAVPFAVVVTFMSIVRVQKRMRALLVLERGNVAARARRHRRHRPACRCRRGRLCLARHPARRRRHTHRHRAPSAVVAVPQRSATHVGGGATTRSDLAAPPPSPRDSGRRGAGLHRTPLDDDFGGCQRP